MIGSTWMDIMNTSCIIISSYLSSLIISMAICPDLSRISVLAPSHHGLILGKSRKPSAYQAPGETMLLLGSFKNGPCHAPRTHPKTLSFSFTRIFGRTVGGKWISQVSYKIEQVPIKIHKGHWNDMQDVHGFGSEIKHDKNMGYHRTRKLVVSCAIPTLPVYFDTINQHLDRQCGRKQTEIQLNGILDLRLEQPSMFFAPLFALYPPPCTWSVHAFSYGAAVLSGEHCWV